MFRCLRCAQCCKNKHPCIYSSERELALKLASQKSLQLELVPFRFDFDLTNEVIIVLIYRFSKKPCIFLKNNECTIQEEKFIACRKYPIASWLDMGFLSLLGFNKIYYDLDTTCSFFQADNQDAVEWKNWSLEKIFPDEVKATLEDRRLWLNMEKALKDVAKKRKYEIITDVRLKKRIPESHEIFLKNWVCLSHEEYMKEFGLE
ncbi:MAG: YkgJ family cysteine cluster protein [Candidatus Helarchaeales archaeon]